MKVLKIKLYQELVNYRKSYSYNFLESYPLPPFSVIKGWIYCSINAEEPDLYYSETINDLKIAVSGKIEGITHDLQHMIKLEKMSDFEKVEENLKTRTPTYVTLISAIDLNIYISANKQLLNDFQKNMYRNYPSLGRYEDLLLVQSSDVINIEERSLSPRNGHYLDYYTYISENKYTEFTKIRGSFLRIPIKYNIDKDIRYFERQNVLCLADTALTEGVFYFDAEEGDDGRLIDFIH